MGARKRTRMKPRRRARFRRIIVKPLTGARLKREVDKELAPRYRVACYYFGLDRKLDAKLAKLARRPNFDSGMFMRLELRDVNFTFKTWRQARTAADRIKAALPDVRVVVDGSWEIK